MKIVNWNCAGAFRNKIEAIHKFNADIYVIQECEHPDKFIKKSDLKDYNFIWKGDNPNKGLAVFSKSSVNIKELTLDENYRNRQLKWFLPVRVNDSFDLVAVWTHKADAEAFQYIGQFYWFLENNLEVLKLPAFVGDYNSNSIWDAWDRWWNHSDIVTTLAEHNIYSLYHKISHEAQGSETLKTFYHRKKIEKGYHIDYIFAANDHINNTESFIWGDYNNWLVYSDHIPLVWKLKLKNN